MTLGLGVEHAGDLVERDASAARGEKFLLVVIVVPVQALTVHAAILPRKGLQGAMSPVNDASKPYLQLRIMSIM